MTRHRSPFLLLLVVLGLLAGACASTSEQPFASGVTTTTAAAQTGPTTTVRDPACVDDKVSASYKPPATMPTPGDMPAGSYMAEVKARDLGGGQRALVAGVGADTLLFGFLNPKTGNLEGFDVEMAKLVGKAIFGPSFDPERNLRLVPLQSSERIARLRTPVAQGGVDLVIKTMTITCQRWAQIDFSTTYYESGQKLLVPATSDVTSIDQAAGLRICAVAGTTSLVNLQNRGLQVITEGDWTDCLVDVQQGRADAVSTDDTILAGLSAQDPQVKVVGEPFTAEPYGIGLPQGHQEFTRFVNGVLEQARADGAWQTAYNNLLLARLGPSKPPPAVYR